MRNIKFLFRVLLFLVISLVSKPVKAQETIKDLNKHIAQYIREACPTNTDAIRTSIAKLEVSMSNKNICHVDFFGDYKITLVEDKYDMYFHIERNDGKQVLLLSSELFKHLHARDLELTGIVSNN